MIKAKTKSGLRSFEESVNVELKYILKKKEIKKQLKKLKYTIEDFNFSQAVFVLHIDHWYTVILQVINLILLYSPVKICSLTAERSEITRNGFPKA